MDVKPMDVGDMAHLVSATMSVLALAVALWSARAKRFETTIAEIKREAAEAIAGLRRECDSFAESARSERARAFERIDGAEQRLASVEAELRHLPDKDLVHSLQVGLARIEGQMTTLNERVTPIARSLDRVEQTLMERADK